MSGEEPCQELFVPSLYRGPGGTRSVLTPPEERPPTKEEPLTLRDLSGLYSDLGSLHRQIDDFISPQLKAILAKSGKYDINGLDTLNFRNLFLKSGLQSNGNNNGTLNQAARADHYHIGSAGRVTSQRQAVWFIGGTLTAGSEQGARLKVQQAAWTFAIARAYAKTAPTGAAILVDINRSGTSIFATRLTIAINGNEDNGAYAFVANVTGAVGDVFTMDIDQVGSGTAGADLTVELHFSTFTLG